MKNKLSHYHFPDIIVSKNIQDHFRNLKIQITETINIMRIGEDIILTNGNVEKHTDNTVKGKDSIMLVLVSDGIFIFDHEDCQVTLRSGDIIRFDGNKNHSLYNANNKKGIFCAVIWDVKKESGIDDLSWSLKERLKEIKSEINKNTLQ